MEYSIEGLGAERFQQLCQSLVVNEYPGVQCLPVAQPDGGRDAFTLSSTGTPEIVFQVKFVHRPGSWNDVVDWLEGVLDSEIEKVKRLSSRGATRYILITNASGTAHLDRGSIDRLQRQLDRLPVPAQCWWRDDICRRLDGAWDIKWSFPELMSGTDLLRLLVENRISEEQSRRAIRAFVVDQHAKEQEVKFKQVELQNRLLDLFVDVPVTYLEERVSKSLRHNRLSVFRSLVYQSQPTGDPHRGRMVRPDALNGDDAVVGGAMLLLSDTAQQNLKKIVIEGAPGQGKSTISQYICQVHRIRILKHPDAAGLPEWQKGCPLRLPFKVDLRDLAAWLDGVNPFNDFSRDDDEKLQKRSLETFLAAQVSFHSGGADFSVNNLLAILSVSPSLVVFDGLDEVGKRQHRQFVIEEILNGVRRIESNCMDLQVVVTSRPAAFSLSPGLPANEYTHFSLAQLPRPVIDEYAEKWTVARNLSPVESRDVKRILREKLDSPHLRDLARNPMQLAILLSLIHTRGSSLPDKRTALYDSYVELFFNRESEKSKIVRDHRPLLIDIHRFLGWELHARSEVGKGRGIITGDELLELLTGYLRAQEYDESLASELFDGMIERVVAIVSRVQGTYEFEVQPLREYFAARHLYETAPYSPPGNERSGTKPERFEALAKNFFWLNVTRFYAGCYSVGELPSLVDGLQSLSNDSDYKYISHPKTLAATLLSDWVFAQHPRSVKDVLRLILDGSGLPFYISSLQRRRVEGSSLALPTDAGRRELLTHAFDLLKHGDQSSRHAVAGQAIELINQNHGSQDVRSAWDAELLTKTSDAKSRWLQYGVQLGFIGQSSDEELESYYPIDELGYSEVWGLMNSNKSEWLECDANRFQIALATVANSPNSVYGNNGKHVLDRLSAVLDPEPYAYLFAHANGESALDCFRTVMSWRRAGLDSDMETVRTEVTQVGWRILDQTIEELRRPVSHWLGSIDPWTSVIESIRPICGEQGNALILSCVGARIRAPSETCTDSSDLLNSDLPLSRRVRYARLRAGQSSWWERQLAAAANDEQTELVLVLLLLWGSPALVQNLSDRIQSAISSLSQAKWTQLNETVSHINLVLFRFGSSSGPASLQVIPEVDTKTLVFLVPRMSQKQRRSLYLDRLSSYRGDDRTTLRIQSSIAYGELHQDNEIALESLEVISRAFQMGVGSPHMLRHFGRQLTPNLSREILKRSDRLPSFLLVQAEECLRESVGKSSMPVLQVAQSSGWFH